MTTYRLPDWLGGHEVEIYAIGQDGDTATLGILGHPHDKTVRVPREWLVEVPPPSIDDPVGLPLFLEDVESDRMPDRGLLVSTGRVPGSKSVIELTAKGTPVTGNATVSISIDLTAEQSRDLARAAWRLGTGGDAQPEGPVQVQRPGTGAS